MAQTLFGIKTLRTITEDHFVHILDDTEEWAIKSAMAANRPLLVRGEPGIGKTQLAQAAAIDLSRPLVSLSVDSSTDSRELMWTFDAVQRLAEAQILSEICKDEAELQKRIAVKKFVRPGPLWWAYDWGSAEEQLDSVDAPPKSPENWSPTNGVVVLIDEIDKAESDVPNGLLEALGAREFKPLGRNTPVALSSETAAPLIVITTNEERILPNAFVRRCFVLNLELPDVMTDEGEPEFVNHLVDRGRAHFPDTTDKLLNDAAELLVKDRKHAITQQQQPLPGQAEYLDFLRAITEMSKPAAEGGQGKDVDEIFDNIATFVFKKSQERRR